MIRAQKKTYTLERKLFYAGLLSVIVVSVAYVYFVSAAVAHVVVRKELSQEITKTQTRISDLETEYILAKDAVGEHTAFEKGFEKNEKKVFVTRAKSSLVLSRSNERE